MSPEPRILVIGHSGQVARALVERAQALRLSLIALGRPELDLGDPTSLARAIGELQPNLIVNAAAYTAVDLAETEERRAFAVNADGAANVAKAAGARPLIHISTDYVFDGQKRTPYVEDDPTSPLNVYGRSKLAGEAAVLKVQPGAIIVRTSWVFSPFGSNFVKTMLKLAESRDLVRVVDDQIGSPTSALDLADAILAIARQGILTGDKAGLYHLANGGETTWFGFAEAIFANLRQRGQRTSKLHPITTADYPTPAKRPRNSRLACDKADSVFRVRLPPWQAGLARCMDRLLSPLPS
jgi:dTDP-4-dehydrorhamnose reductase